MNEQLSQYNVNIDFVNAVLKQLLQIEKEYNELDSAKKIALKNSGVITDGRLVLPLLPSELNIEAREMLMRNMTQNMDTGLTQKFQKLSNEQYTLALEEIKPRLLIIKRLQNMIDQANMTQYGQVDVGIQQKLAQILADTEDPVKRYLQNRDMLMKMVEDMMRVRVVGA